MALKSLLDHKEKEKGTVGCVCGILVAYKAICSPASDLGSLGLVRRKNGESSVHTAVPGWGCEEEEAWVPWDLLTYAWRCSVPPGW